MEPIVKTRYGAIRGIHKEGCLQFRGIPYAKPPVGELRFRKPQKPEPWNGTLSCTSFAPIAMQGPIQGHGELYTKEFYSDTRYYFPCSEDCLYLNIWAPEDGEKHPVALWIHGGSYRHGYSCELEFDGAAYAKRGIILVTIAYRCNVFGFLAHPELSENDPDGVFGNYGLYDQIAALDWIYDNIDNFGGDKNNITVFGQSAGAMSAQMLISTELTGNRIAKAIFQSGGGYDCGYPYIDTKEKADKIGNAFLDFIHVNSINELYHMPAEKLLNYSIEFRKQMFRSNGSFSFAPCIDGTLLKHNCDDCVRNGMIKDIPYIIGCTENDLSSNEKSEPEADFPLYEGCKKFALEAEKQHRKSVYVYYFAHKLPGDNTGAFHSAELWYIFGTLARSWRPFTDKDYLLSNEMLDYWTSFMKYGNPNNGKLPEWNPYTINGKAIKTFF